MDELRAVKRLGGNRVGHYAVLWGDPAKRDLTGEYFTRRTQDLDTLFRAVGRLPLLYQHTLDDQLKTSVVGLVDVLSPDDVGLWYEAQLTMAGEYRAAMEELIGAGALGTSSGTLPGARRVDRRTGEIKRWAIAELSLTPTPAEPRMMERPAAEIKAAWKAAGLRMPALTPLTPLTQPLPGGEGPEAEGKAANMADWLESRLHQTWTVLADDLFGDGRLSRTERIALSGLIGDALEVFHAGLQDEVLAGVRVRNPWEDAPPPDDDEDVSPDEEPDRGAENARSAKGGRADSGPVGRPAKAGGGDAGGSRYAGGTGYSTGGDGNGDAGNGPAREIDVELERVALLEV